MKKKNIIGITVTLILVLLGIVSIGATLSIALSPLSSVIKFIVFGIIVSYTLYDYLSPHSNILKYVMILFSFSLIATENTLISVLKTALNEPAGVQIGIVVCMFAMVLIGYMAGRLNKLKKNIIVMALVTVLLVITAVVGVIGLETDKSVALIVLRAFGDVIAWLALCSAYLTGYEGHKEAGQLADEKSAE